MPIKRKTLKRGGFQGQAEQKISAWSYSRWRDWNECPQKAKYKYIERLPDPGGPALVRGSEIHEQCENYLNGTGPITAAMQAFSEDFEEILGKKAQAELALGFTDSWEPCEWMARNIYCRVKIDARVPESKTHTRIIDFKTGKIRTIDQGQVQLYAFAEMCFNPQAKRVDVELWYLDEEEIIEATYTRAKHHKQIREIWDKRAKPMLDDRAFKAKPSAQSCRFCPFHPKKGGPCEVGV